MLRSLQVLAEFTKRLSPDLTRSHVDIDWRGIAGMRNVLVHDYLGVKLDRVWEIVQQDLPNLRRAIVEIRATLSQRA